MPEFRCQETDVEFKWHACQVTLDIIRRTQEIAERRKVEDAEGAHVLLVRLMNAIRDGMGHLERHGVGGPDPLIVCDYCHTATPIDEVHLDGHGGHICVDCLQLREAL